MPVFAVTYRYDDRDDLRDEHRPAHRSWLAGLFDEGRLLASGPFAGGSAGGALLIFRLESASAVEDLVRQDPFAEVGAIAETTVREWTPVFGPWAAQDG